MKSLISKLLRVLLLAFAVATLGYGWLAYDYWSNPPRLTRNYTAELNAPILKIPDGRRATDDLLALLGIAEHLRQIPLFLGEFAAWQRSTNVLKLWGRLLEQHPEAFDDGQLQELEAAVRNRSIGDLNAAFAAARIEFLDQVQRCYGDDGNGDGRLYSTAGLTYADPRLDSSAWQDQIFDPLQTRFLPSRRETIAEYDALHSLAAVEAARPYWECDVWKSEERYNQLRVERSHPLILDFGAYGETLNRLQQGFLQARDAMLTASALVRFRRKQGAWPKRLAELVPAYMPELPVDRFTGKPLGYVPNELQPVLYAAGPDRRDDGGKPARIITTHRKRPGAELERNDFPWYWDFWRGTQDGDLILWPVAPPETTTQTVPDEVD